MQRGEGIGTRGRGGWGEPRETDRRGSITLTASKRLIHLHFFFFGSWRQMPHVRYFVYFQATRVSFSLFWRREREMEQQRICTSRVLSGALFRAPGVRVRLDTNIKAFNRNEFLNQTHLCAHKLV